MSNPMYPIILEQMGQILKLSRRELESDIKSIAEYWETCLDKTSVTDRDAAIFILTTCATCYLRGRGIKLGSYRSAMRNNNILISFVTLIPLYAWRHNPDNYPLINSLLPIESSRTDDLPAGNDILAQAEKILREKRD